MKATKMQDKPLLERDIDEIFEIKERLKEALSSGVSKKGACAYAHVTESEYEDIVRMDSELSEIAERADSELGAQAMINIAKQIRNGNANTTKWYLERVENEKFGRTDGIKIEVPVEEKAEHWAKKLKEICNE